MTVMDSSASTTSSALASRMMTGNGRTTDYGRYGNLAADHMARWLPTAFAAVEDREGYFRALDDRVANTIRDREVSWVRRSRSDYAARGTTPLS